LCHVPRAGVTHDLVVKEAINANLHIRKLPIHFNNDKHEYEHEHEESYPLPDQCPKYDAERACIYIVQHSR